MKNKNIYIHIFENKSGFRVDQIKMRNDTIV